MAAAAVGAQRSVGRLSAGRARGRTTPAWLRLTSSLLGLVAVAAAVLVLVGVLGRQAATTSARTTAEPLLIDAQTVITSLSDAPSR